MTTHPKTTAALVLCAGALLHTPWSAWAQGATGTDPTTNPSTTAPPPLPPPGAAPPAVSAAPASPPQSIPPPSYPPSYPAYPPGPVYSPPPPPPKPEPPTRYVTATFSPLHLIQPMFVASVEVRVHNHVGLAVMGGGGQIRVTGSKTYTFNAYELGGQVIVYPISRFERGLQLLVEGLYLRVDTKDYAGSVEVTGMGEGFAIGPMVGYKLCTDGGFSFVAQGGVGFVAARASAKTTSGESASANESSVLPLLNLHIGWSF